MSSAGRQEDDLHLDPLSVASYIAIAAFVIGLFIIFVGSVGGGTAWYDLGGGPGGLQMEVYTSDPTIMTLGLWIILVPNALFLVFSLVFMSAKFFSIHRIPGDSPDTEQLADLKVILGNPGIGCAFWLV